MRCRDAPKKTKQKKTTEHQLLLHWTPFIHRGGSNSPARRQCPHCYVPVDSGRTPHPGPIRGWQWMGVAGKSSMCFGRIEIHSVRSKIQPRQNPRCSAIGFKSGQIPISHLISSSFGGYKRSFSSRSKTGQLPISSGPVPVPTRTAARLFLAPDGVSAELSGALEQDPARS